VSKYLTYNVGNVTVHKIFQFRQMLATLLLVLPAKERLKTESESFSYASGLRSCVRGVNLNVRVYPFTDEAQSVLFKDPVRTAL